MNESAAGDSQAPMRGPDRSIAAGFGPTLAQARARAGLSMEEAAARLRLHPRQLDALEHEDLEVLPAAAYVSGFVRNYARELKIDAQPLIDDLNAKLALRGSGRDSLDLSSPGRAHTPVLDDRDWRHLMLAGIIALLVCAGLIGVWMARPRAVDTAALRLSPPALRPPVAEARPPAASSPIAGPASDRGDAPRAEAAADGAPASDGTGAAVGAPAAATRAGAATAAAGNPPILGLLLRFNERSWVEVSEPDGRVLMSRNGEAGSMELLNTTAPLLVVVGRPDAVQVEYRGQPVDLKPYVNSKGVARLMFADGRVSSGGSINR